MNMHRTAIALAAVATVALAGCGGGHRKLPADDATRGMSPLAAVEQGYAKLRGKPSHMGVAMNISYTTDSNVPEEIKNTFSGLAVKEKEEIAIADQRRANATLDASPVHGAKIVLYDGTVYFSADGETYKQVTGQLGSLFAGITSMSRQLNGKSFAGVRYVGYEGDGKHYSGTLSAAATRAMESLSASQGAPGTTARSAHVDTWIDPKTGLVTRQKSNVVAAIDLSKLNQPGATGTVTMHLSSDLQIHDVGKPVVVNRPAASGTASSWTDLLG
jgi:hypothetical protein